MMLALCCQSAGCCYLSHNDVAINIVISIFFLFLLFRLTSPTWELQLDSATGTLTSLRRRYQQVPWQQHRQQHRKLHDSSNQHKNSIHSNSGWLGVDWAAPDFQNASSNSSFLQLVYSTYVEEDFSIFKNEYNYKYPQHDWWFDMDLCKRNCSVAKPVREDIPARLQAAYAEGGDTQTGAKSHLTTHTAHASLNEQYVSSQE